ncbi:hypothetical protein Ccrd_002048 [Cynara cardunculus var. scolymus]|uniref:GPI-anchored protein LLG1-like domain-containing protein n=1 Tax=Cynara cardunculus var. scolymus TaxID=59895 RepID=A0A103XS48_CYNCS|nr:hypothetical protein Ccrd_002048 [Cynara cardunculus var. scolymus]
MEKKACPVDFERKNYTDLTSHCKGPHYQPKPCCDALARIACPHLDVINDLSNDCAIAMFGNINYHGHYPTGLFARMCSDGKKGLKCP